MSITNRKERTDGTPSLKYKEDLTSCQGNTLVSDNAIFENMNHIEIYSHCLIFKKRFKFPQKSLRERKIRGIINHFSKRSRFRLFTLLSMIDQNLDNPPLFVSLTYHYGHENDKTPTKSQLHNFLVQLRNFDPLVQFIWRFEFQKRGAPHYHLIIFPGPQQNKRYVKDYINRISFIWHEIADPGSRKHKEYGCKVVEIRSYREACSYLSKYIAKAANEFIEQAEGKYWGNSRNLPIKCHKIIGAFDDEAKILIEKIRSWMLANGKGKFADPNFLNIHCDFVVFIDQKDTLDFFDDTVFFRTPL